MHHREPSPIPATKTPVLCACAALAVLFSIAGVSRANLILDGSFAPSELPPAARVPGLSLPWLGSPGSAAPVPGGTPAIRLPSDRYPILALASDAGRPGILENGPVGPGGSGFQFFDLKALQDPAANVDPRLRLAAYFIAPVTQAGIFAATGKWTDVPAGLVPSESSIAPTLTGSIDAFEPPRSLDDPLPIEPIPEPGTALVGVACIGVAALRRRRRSAGCEPLGRTQPGIRVPALRGPALPAPHGRAGSSQRAHEPFRGGPANPIPGEARMNFPRR